MRITFGESGGFAYVPGLAAPITIDVSSLAPGAQDELRQLVLRSAFFDLPPHPAIPHRGADLRTYTITVEEEGRSHTAELSEPLPPGALRVLVDRLRWHAALARRGGTKQ